MKIEINNNTKAVSLLITKFLELNDKSEYNYLDNDTLFVGYNSDSGFSYIALENDPSLCLCLDYSGNLCIVYSSTLDGLEFIKYDFNNINSLSDLENLISEAYQIDEKREDNYKDNELKEAFISEMIENGWDEL